MNILIITCAADIHATAVEWLLRRWGHNVVTWIIPDFPARQQSTLAISPSGQSQITLRGPEVKYDGEDFDTVWLRRIYKPVLSPDLHPADKAYASRESISFVRNLRHMISPNAFWVNPPRQQETASLKAAQLVAAAGCGLRIPATLMSNDVEKVREFFDTHNGNIVFKPFLQSYWDTETTTASLWTSRVDRSVLNNEFAITNCAGIYQPKIQKAYEVRATAIGQHLFAAKLHSQEHAESRLDWRSDVQFRVRAEKMELPSPVQTACRDLMASLGIVFGCFDFIVTEEGEYVFLEVNEMGQFLWVEDRCPDLKLLDAFTRLLISRQTNFALPFPTEAISFNDYRNSEAYTFDQHTRPTLHAQHEQDLVARE